MNSTPQNLRSARATPPKAWRYGATAIALHWVIALLLVGMASVGWYMMSIEDDPGAARLFDLHKSVGLIVAGLVALRIVWRLGHPPSPLPTSVPDWQFRLSAITHGAMYLLLVLIPVAGYLGASFSEEGVQWLGLATPVWATANHDRAEQLFGLHSALVWALVVLLVVHVAGALKHLWVDKDGLFQRMWPW